MNEYMLIFRHTINDGPAPTEEQMSEMTRIWSKWISGIAEKGKFSGTNRLLPEGKTIKNDTMKHDGPYAEMKEMVGGYLIVKAGSLEEAVELAKGCPGLNMDTTVEVRRVMKIESDPKSPNFLKEKQLA